MVVSAIWLPDIYATGIALARCNDMTVGVGGGLAHANE